MANERHVAEPERTEDEAAAAGEDDFHQNEQIVNEHDAVQAAKDADHQ